MQPGPFGRHGAAMITPFTDDGALDLPGARRLASHLVARGGCDALVVGSATGESATTTDTERDALLRAVVEAVGERAAVVAAVGSSDTRRTVAAARAAHAAGAHGLLLSAPRSPRPSQEAVVQHLWAVADATELPVMLHDGPARGGGGADGWADGGADGWADEDGGALTLESLRRLAEHPRIGAVRDCAGDLLKSGRALAETGLAYFSGRDELNLPLRALGGTGQVSVVANVAGRQVRAVAEACDAGDAETAARRHRALLPLVAAVSRGVPSAVAVKALFRAADLPGGPVRAPLLPAGEELTGRLVDAFRAAATAT